MTLLAFLAASGAASAQCPPERITAPVAWKTGFFGSCVQIDGDVAVVGVPSDDTYCPVFACSSGAVIVFRRVEGSWSAEQTVFHSRISERDVLGRAISLDGPDRFAATAPGEDAAAADSGAVYIFEHDGGEWKEVAEILPVEPMAQTADGFGSTVALRGDTLVVGQPQHPVSPTVSTGAAWVYRLIDGRWEFTQKLVPPDPRNGARFGNALALDGEWLVVGAYADEEIGYGAGAVYTYRRGGRGEYELFRKLFAPRDPALQVFGFSVAIEDDTLAVGATNGPSPEARGAVYAFEFDGAEWRHTATLEHDDPVKDDALGISIGLHDDAIVAGATRQPQPSGSRGAAYLFHRGADGSWRQAAKLVPGPDSFDFGRAVATDGASAIVGAPKESVSGLSAAGAAHIYDLGCLLCRADLDGDGALTFFDFLAFQSLFAAGDPSADFDGDSALTFFDFLAFQAEFAAGCA